MTSTLQDGEGHLSEPVVQTKVDGVDEQVGEKKADVSTAQARHQVIEDIRHGPGKITVSKQVCNLGPFAEYNETDSIAKHPQDPNY